MKKIVLIVIAGFVLFTGLICIIRIKSNYANYYYETNQDYAYPFDASSSEKKNLVLDTNSVEFPGQLNLFSTGFIEVDFKSTILGYMFQPYVLISNKGIVLKEYYELGVQGKRFINISAFLNKTDIIRKLNIHTSHMKIKNKLVKFIGFKNPPVDNNRILIIAPHPDDAEIAAFGLYSNKKAYIVTITSGDSGKYFYQNITNNTQNFLIKGQLRAWDSNVVPIWGGIPGRNILNLGYFDRTLQAMYRNPDAAISSNHIDMTDTGRYRTFNQSDMISKEGSSATWINLINDLSSIISYVRPDIIVTPHPILDTHEDHKYVTVALIEALKLTDIKHSNLFLYTNHYVYSEHYPFGEIYSNITLPPWFDSNGYLFSSIYSYTLSKEQQMRKLFGLEAMHDLRLISGYTYEDPYKDIIISFKNGILNIMGRGPSRYSYFRRAIRNNELFFIVNYEDIGKLEQITNSFLNMKDRSTYYNK